MVGDQEYACIAKLIPLAAVEPDLVPKIRTRFDSIDALSTSLAILLQTRIEIYKMTEHEVQQFDWTTTGSSEELPIVNFATPLFDFGCAARVCARYVAELFRIDPDGVGVEVGIRLLCERAEHEIWSLEKPRTMLVALTSVLVVSLPASGGLMSEKSSVATVDVEESRT